MNEFRAVIDAVMGSESASVAADGTVSVRAGDLLRCLAEAKGGEAVVSPTRMGRAISEGCPDARKERVGVFFYRFPNLEAVERTVTKLMAMDLRPTWPPAV